MTRTAQLDMHNVPVSRYMTPSPTAVAEEAPLEQALDLMNEHQIRHLPVLRGDTLVGLVSERDLALVETLVPDSWQTLAVAEAMSTGPYAVAPDAPLGRVARDMADAKYGSAVVVDAAGHIVGIFTTTDALDALADACNLGPTS